MDDYMARTLAGIDADNAEITFSSLAPCRGTEGWIGAGAGCGRTLRLHYLAGMGPQGWWTCPVCGCRYPFTFWKIKSDPDYAPGAEEAAEIRGLWRDITGRARDAGYQFQHEVSFEERIRIHVDRLPPEGEEAP